MLTHKKNTDFYKAIIQPQHPKYPIEWMREEDFVEQLKV
jgi:hypothetical protein